MLVLVLFGLRLGFLVQVVVVILHRIGILKILVDVLQVVVHDLGVLIVQHLLVLDQILGGFRRTALLGRGLARRLLGFGRGGLTGTSRGLGGGLLRSALARGGGLRRRRGLGSPFVLLRLGRRFLRGQTHPPAGSCPKRYSIQAHFWQGQIVNYWS